MFERIRELGLDRFELGDLLLQLFDLLLCHMVTLPSVRLPFNSGESECRTTMAFVACVVSFRKTVSS
jgi:hypothetical protein